MKNIIFKNGTEDINSAEEHVFSGLGKVRINSSEGVIVVVCYLADGSLWRAAVSPADSDSWMPDWRTTYAISDDGVIPEFIVHAPDDAISSVEESSLAF